MSEITREEAKAVVQKAIAHDEAIARICHPDDVAEVLRYVAAFRLALAALEDAERYEQAIRWALGEDGEFAMWPGYGEGRRPADGLSPRVGYFWWRTELRQRAAIDRARGAEKRERPQVPPNIDL